MRQYIIERHIFRHLKFNVGYRNFLLRGLEKVKGEYKLMCIGWNLKKMLKMGIKLVRIQDEMVQIKHMLLQQLQILLKREKKYDPVEKLKLIPGTFRDQTYFIKYTSFFLPCEFVFSDNLFHIDKFASILSVILKSRDRVSMTSERIRENQGQKGSHLKY